VKKDELEAYKMLQKMEVDKKIEENNIIIKSLIPQKVAKNMDA
jgi:hypothetical protein